MSKKAVSFIGIAAGIIIIIFSIVVFNSSPVFNSSGEASITTIDAKTVTPETEYKSRYGGDAYTGMQNASAQAATNIVAVYNSVNQTNANLETLNKNLINSTKKQAQNNNAMASLIRTAFGFLLLALGLMTVVRHLGMLSEALESEPKTNNAFSGDAFKPEFNAPSSDFTPNTNHSQNSLAEKEQVISSSNDAEN